jgi:peptidoglycan/xylan/chitin deacetylase (PgdA/CDA1 family)
VVTAGHSHRRGRLLGSAAILAVAALSIGLYGGYPWIQRAPNAVAAAAAPVARPSARPTEGRSAASLDLAPATRATTRLRPDDQAPAPMDGTDGSAATLHSCVVNRAEASGQRPGAGDLGESPSSGGAVLHVPILTYHVVAPWPVARPYSLVGLDVTPAEFDAQLRGLRDQGWRTITVADLARLLATGARPDPRTFAITIDDGHRDGYTYALPVLRANGFVATFYVVAGRVGAGSYLSWDEIRTLQADGMEIGSHTVDHVPLAGLSAASLACEVNDAQAIFRDHLGAAPTTFAYPFGSLDGAAGAAVEAAGLLVAVTTHFGRAEAWSARFALPRIHVGPAATAERLLKLFATYG